jgi:hypothetical protein
MENKKIFCTRLEVDTIEQFDQIAKDTNYSRSGLFRLFIKIGIEAWIKAGKPDLNDPEAIERIGG